MFPGIHPRNCLLDLANQVGGLCEIFQWRGEVDTNLNDWALGDKCKLETQMGYVLYSFNRLRDACGITKVVEQQQQDLDIVIKQQQQLMVQQQQQLVKFGEMRLEELRMSISEWCKERNWEQYHSPRNILFALVGEVGELCEIFRWQKDASLGLPELSEESRTHVGEELSDVLNYVIRLSDRCGIDLSDAMIKKMKKNSEKYPVERVYGSSKKYNEYTNIVDQ